MITISDVRSAGYCVRGAKTWFENHDLDFAEFLRDGITEERFLATGDALAQDVVDRLNGCRVPESNSDSENNDGMG